MHHMVKSFTTAPFQFSGRQKNKRPRLGTLSIIQQFCRQNFVVVAKTDTTEKKWITGRSLRQYKPTPIPYKRKTREWLWHILPPAVKTNLTWLYYIQREILEHLVLEYIVTKQHRLMKNKRACKRQADMPKLGEGEHISPCLAGHHRVSASA